MDSIQEELSAMQQILQETFGPLDDVEVSLQLDDTDPENEDDSCNEIDVDMATPDMPPQPLKMCQCSECEGEEDGGQKEAARVCHHPGCTEKNDNRPMLLCKECDDNIHQRPEYSGHLVLDAPKKKSTYAMLSKFTSAPNLQESSHSDNEVTDTVMDEVDRTAREIIQNGERELGEVEKKLKRKKALKQKRRHTDDQRSNSVGDIYAKHSLSDDDEPEKLVHRNSYAGHTTDFYNAVENLQSKSDQRSTPTQSRRTSKCGINHEHFTLKFTDSPEEDIEIVAAAKNVTLSEAIQPILDRRGLDINLVNVYVEASNTPLPLNCETFLLGGNSLHLKEKDGDSLPSGTQSLSKATGAKLTGGKSQSSKSSKSGMNRRESVVGRSTSLLEPPINVKQRRSSLQLPFPAFFPLQKMGEGLRANDDQSTGSLRSRRGINLSIDDTTPMSLSASVSPQGTLRESEGRKQKPQNKLSNLFSPMVKDKEKQEQLSDILNNYSTNGLPSPPSLVQIGQQHINPHILFVEPHWSAFVHNASSLSKRQHDQQEAIWELLQTEVHYIQSLRVITDLFLCVLLNIQNELLLNEIETEKLFNNIGDIASANGEFWEKYLVKVIQESRKSGDPLNPSTMKEGLKKFHDIFTPYLKYCSKQKACLDYMKSQYSDNDLFRVFVVWAETQKQCNRLKLTDLLVKPMQRLTKYSLLLQAILRKTEDEHQRKDVLEMIASVDRFVSHVNATLRQQHEEEKLQAIVDKIESYDASEAPNDECLKLIQQYNLNFNLAAPMPGCNSQDTRALVMQSPLKLKDSQSRMDVECLLFTDLMLVCKSNKRMDKYKIVKPPMRVDRIIIHELKDKGSFLLIYVNEYHVPVSSFTFHADQMAIRLWIDHIRKAQEMYRETRLASSEHANRSPYPEPEVVEEVIGYSPLIVDNPPLIHLARANSESPEGFEPNSGSDTDLSSMNRSKSWTDMPSVLGHENSPHSDMDDSDNKHKSVQYSNSVPTFTNKVPGEDTLRVPPMHMQPGESELSLPDIVDESMRAKLNQRRSSRTEKRYHTADAIQEIQKKETKDTNIYKRLSWNFGMGDVTEDKQGVLKVKTQSSDSIRSIHSSSGVSSTGSLHLSPDGDICEEGEYDRDNGIDDTSEGEITLDDINEDDYRDSLCPESKQSKSKSTSDIVTLMHELSTNDVKDGISSVDFPRDDAKRKLTHAEILRMKRQLLLSSNVEASEV